MRRDAASTANSARIVVFTKYLIVTVTAEVDGDGQHHTTKARRRADLRTINVAAETGALDNPLPSDWPGRVGVKLDYGDGKLLELPGSELAGRDQHERVVVLLPPLRADLTGLAV